MGEVNSVTENQVQSSGGDLAAPMPPQAKGDVPGGVAPRPAQPAGDFVSAEDLRKLQAAKDREIASLRRQLAEHEANVASLQATMEQSLPDDQRAQFFQQRQAAELAQLKAERARRDALELVSSRYGVPMDVVQDARTPDEMKDMAMTWLAEQRVSAAKVVPATTPASPAPAVEEKEDEADAPVSKSTPSGRIIIDSGDRVKELKSAVEKGAMSPRDARLAFLKSNNQKRAKPSIG